jgi:transcriptional regulator with XRE-family HTH domain
MHGRGHYPQYRPTATARMTTSTGAVQRPLRTGRLDATTTARHRPTATARETRRLSEAVAASLGQQVRVRRKRLGLTQERLAVRVGVHQTLISRIELGRGRAVPLETWVALGGALGQPLAVTFTRPLDQTRGPSDAGHLKMQEALLRLARETGRPATFELPTRPADPARSIDVCVRDRRTRVLFIEEAWNTVGDLGAAIRATHRKAAEAADLAATIDDGPPYRVAVVWVVMASAANIDLVRRYPTILANAFPGSSRAWVGALAGDADPPDQPGLVWYDAGTRRLHAWRRSRR